MAKKKTKKQKQQTQERVVQSLTSSTFSFIESDPGSSDTTKKNRTNKAANNGLWMYDPTYIKQDIRKTLLISLSLTAVLLGMYTARTMGIIPW